MTSVPSIEDLLARIEQLESHLPSERLDHASLTSASESIEAISRRKMLRSLGTAGLGALAATAALAPHRVAADSFFPTTGAPYKLSTDVNSGNVSATLNAALPSDIGTPSNSGWIIISAFTKRCEIRKITEIIGSTVKFAPGLENNHEGGDTVLWTDNPVYNVRLFGAVGDGDTNTTANDTDAIRATVKAALDLSVQGERLVLFPKGVYVIDGDNVLGPGSTQAVHSGIHFQGEGWFTSVLKLREDSAARWLYRTGGLRYATFSDLRFEGVLGSNKTNGFLLNTNGHENGFQFHRCWFTGLHTVFMFDGTVNNDSHRFFGCNFSLINGKVFHISDPQAVCLELYGTNVTQSRGDIFYVAGGIGNAGGGDLRVFGGSFIIGDFYLDADSEQDIDIGDLKPLETEAWLLNINGSQYIGPGNCTFVFEGIRTELHGQGAKLARINGSTIITTNNVTSEFFGIAFAQFIGCNFENTKGGQREAVQVGMANKQVLFKGCRMPDTFQYRLGGTATASQYGVPGRVSFQDCSIPRGIWQSVLYADPSMRYQRFDIENCWRERSVDTLEITKISTGSTGTTVTTRYPHGLSTGEYIRISQGGSYNTGNGSIGPIRLDNPSEYKFSYGSTSLPTTTTDWPGPPYALAHIIDVAFDGSRNMPKTLSGIVGRTYVARIFVPKWPDQSSSPIPSAQEQTGTTYVGGSVMLPPYSVIKNIYVLKRSRGVGGEQYQLQITVGPDTPNTYKKVYVSTQAAMLADHSIKETNLMIRVGGDHLQRVVQLSAYYPNADALTRNHVVDNEDYIIIEYF